MFEVTAENGIREKRASKIHNVSKQHQERPKSAQ